MSKFKLSLNNLERLQVIKLIDFGIHTLHEDMKNHTVTAVFDRGTKVVCFTTDGIFCDGGEKRQFGFTRFNDDFKVTFGNMSDEKMKFAKGIHLYS